MICNIKGKKKKRKFMCVSLQEKWTLVFVLESWDSSENNKYNVLNTQQINYVYKTDNRKKWTSSTQQINSVYKIDNCHYFTACLHEEVYNHSFAFVSLVIDFFHVNFFFYLPQGMLAAMIFYISYIPVMVNGRWQRPWHTSSYWYLVLDCIMITWRTNRDWCDPCGVGITKKSSTDAV